MDKKSHNENIQICRTGKKMENIAYQNKQNA